MVLQWKVFWNASKASRASASPTSTTATAAGPVLSEAEALSPSTSTANTERQAKETALHLKDLQLQLLDVSFKNFDPKSRFWKSRLTKRFVTNEIPGSSDRDELVLRWKELLEAEPWRKTIELDSLTIYLDYETSPDGWDTMMTANVWVAAAVGVGEEEGLKKQSMFVFEWFEKDGWWMTKGCNRIHGLDPG